MALIKRRHLISSLISLLILSIFALQLVQALSTCATDCQTQLAASDLGCNTSTAVDAASCPCFDKQYIQRYASCVSRNCPKDLEAAWKEIEYNCTEQKVSLAVSRDQFLSAGSCSWPDCLSNPECLWFDCMSGPDPPKKRNITLTFTLPNPTTTSTALESSTSPSSPTSPPPTSTGAAPAVPQPGHQLTQSDKVAIAVGLGVGIPTVLLALLTFLFTVRWSLPWFRRSAQGGNRRNRGRRLERLNSASADMNYGTFDSEDDDAASPDRQSAPVANEESTAERDITELCLL